MSGFPLRQLLACLCLVSAADASQACNEAARERVAQNAEDTDAGYELARSCAAAGRHEEALAQYDLLLARDPGNSDWLLGKAQALIALHRPDEALPLLERGRSIAPAYEDIWRSNATALEILEDYERADTLLAAAGRAFPQSGWPGAKRAALAEQRLLRRGTRISFAASHEDLSGGRDPWQAVTLGVDKPLDDHRRVLGGIHIEERFKARDGQFSFGYVDRVSKDWSFSVSGDLAPGAEVLPEWSFVAEAGRALPGARSIGLRARHASYSTVDVDSLAATIEQYAAQLRVAYTLTGAQPSGLGTSFGHSLRIAHDYGMSSHVTLALGYGEEAETVAPGVVLVTRNKAIGVNGVHWRNASWGYSWEAGWYEQGDLYNRVRISLGLQHRF
ncbi:MAG: YaiO family outer membrane beta-barrel protein [Gammaproteobacteria bacterium]|nr:YaiO family outer membrane beta-barrel protein [Gammaproteobacteria bacterium]